MLIQVTLTIPAGSSVGPFDLFSDVDNYTTAFETNISASELTSGYAVNAPEGSTIIRVKSVGVCTTSIDLPNNCVPAPTPVPVPVTPTPVPVTPTPVPVTPVPVTPTPVPVTPTPVTPTPVPVTPTPVTPTPVPVTPVPVTPTPVTPTPVPVTPTPVPVTPVPVTPTPVPVTPTPVPVTPTPVPVTPTPVPVTPTPVPVTPVPTGPTFTSFTTHSTVEQNAISSCNAQLTSTKFHDGPGTYPVVGNICYNSNTTSSGTLAAGYWGLLNETYIQTNTSGQVIATGGCSTPVPVPVTPTPTPVPTGVTYNYYFVEQCSPGTNDRVARTTSSLNANINPGLANSFTYFGNCYFVKNTATVTDYNNNEGDLSAIDISGYTMLNGCNACTGPAPTPTPTAPSGDCTSYYLINSSGIGTKGFSFTGCGPDLGTNGATVTGDGRKLVCSSTLPTSSDTEVEITDEGPCGSTPTPTPTPTPVPVATTCTPFVTGAVSNFNNVCESIGFNSHGHNGSGDYPGLNDVVYETNSCSTPLAEGYYQMDNAMYIRVGLNGEVIGLGSCSEGGELNNN